MQMYQGATASPGLVMGPVRRLRHSGPGLERVVQTPGREQALLNAAVVLAKDELRLLEEAAEGKGKGAQNADPADFPGIQYRPQTEIYAHGNSDGQQCKNELAERKPEKQTLLIIPDFFVDAYFYSRFTSFPILCFRQTGLAMSVMVC